MSTLRQAAAGEDLNQINTLVDELKQALNQLAVEEPGTPRGTNSPKPEPDVVEGEFTEA